MMRKQRRLSIKFGIILVIIGLVAIQEEAYGQSWKWEFCSAMQSAIFYDPDRL
jgi:hypothetical protein